jgi:hypothetical protein
MSDDFEPEELDPAEQAAAEDGFPSVRQFLPSLRHPAYAASRRHFKANPLPQQQNRRAS